MVLSLYQIFTHKAIQLHKKGMPAPDFNTGRHAFAFLSVPADHGQFIVHALAHQDLVQVYDPIVEGGCTGT